MMGRALAATLLIALILTYLRTPALSLGKNNTASAEASLPLLRAADQLDRAAAAASFHARTKAAIPDIRLPATDRRGDVAGRPSLNQWLRAQLGRIRKERSGKTQAADLRDLAAALRRAAEPHTGFAPSHDPNREAAAILAQAAYQTGGAGPAPAPHESIVERTLRWLEDQVGLIIRRIFGATSKVPAIGTIVSIAFIALLAAVAAYLIYLLISAFVRRRLPALADEGTPLQEAVEPNVLYELGMTAANDGQYARAVALLFQASLAAFDRAGKLAYDGSLTPGEYRRAVRRTLSSASPHFDDIARVFVQAAFAERPVSKSDFMTADVAYHSLGALLAS